MTFASEVGGGLPSSAEPRHSAGAGHMELEGSWGAGAGSNPARSGGTRQGGEQVRARVGEARQGTEKEKEGCGGREEAAHPLPPAATRLSGRVPVGAAGGPAVGVRLCPAGNAGNRAVAWGSRGVGKRRRRGPPPAPGAAAARAAPRPPRSRPRRRARPPR